MFQVFFPLTEDGILEPSSGRWLNSGIVSPTECWTLSGSEWPSEGGGFLSLVYLSDILETGDIPQKYYLSQRGCMGILNRAGRHGKRIPKPMEEALLEVARPRRKV
jgi:hypothetical protein